MVLYPTQGQSRDGQGHLGRKVPSVPPMVSKSGSGVLFCRYVDGKVQTTTKM